MQPLQEACDRAGLTYRQGHHWVSSGRLTGVWFSATGENIGDKPAGSGSRCWIATGEAEVMRLAARFLKAGLTVDAALGAARRLAELPGQPVDLGGGVVLEFRESGVVGG